MKFDFFTSDLHFCHENIAPKFGRPFKDVEEHDEELIRRWNSVVGEKDKVLILGDVAFNVGLKQVERLNGFKVLVPGNHDQKEIDAYVEVFDDVKGYVFDRKLGVIFSHIPIHPYCLGERWKYNVHGHSHFGIIQTKNPVYSALDIPDTRYVNICLEQTDYTPLTRDDLIQRLK